MKSLKKATALFLAAAASLAMSAPAGQATWQQVTEKPEQGTIEIQQNNLYTPDGKLVGVGESTGPSPDSLISQITPGEAAAIKSGSYENESDASQGIVRLQFDLQGAPRTLKSPVDVLLVMDQTASMNMYSDYTNSWYMPCLNEEHRYEIPAGTFGDHGAGVLNLLEWNPNAICFQDWFGTADGKPWIRRWVKEMLDSLGPDPDHTKAADTASTAQLQTEEAAPEEIPSEDLTPESALEEETTSDTLPVLSDENQASPLVYIPRTEDEEDAEETSPLAESGDPSMDKVFDSGYAINNKTMMAWNPQSHHCHQVNGSWQTIPVPENHPQMVNGTEVFLHNYSPADGNPYGCKDRAMLSKIYARAFAQELLQRNPANRVGLELFGTKVYDWGRFPFTSDLSSLEEGFAFYQGLRRTNYQAAFETADQMMSSAWNLDEHAAQYVLFVSDGLPDIDNDQVTGNEDAYAALPFASDVNYTAGYQAAEQFKKDHPHTEVFTCGLAVPVENYLSYLASSPEDAKSCSTMDEFQSFLEDLVGRLDTGYIDDGVLSDTISSEFELLVDEKHPFTVNAEEYTAVSELPSTISVDGKTITYQAGRLDENTQTISFYVKADPSILANRSKGILHATNEKASLQYSPVVEKDGTLTKGSLSEKPLPSPLAEFKNSLLSAVKSSVPEAGSKVKIGDEVVYTISITNNGLVDVKNLYIFDEIPKGTEWVSGGDLKGGQVSFVIDSLKAKSTESVSFRVKVSRSAGTLPEIRNLGLFTLNPDSEKKVPTNPVVHPLQKTPAQPSAKPNKPSTGLSTGSLVAAAGAVTAAGLLAWLILKNRKKSTEQR